MNLLKKLVYSCLFLIFLCIFIPTKVFAQQTNGKKIIVSLSHQELTAYNGSLVFLQTPITSGGPGNPTPTGTFAVLAKLHSFVMHSPWPITDRRWYPDSFVNYGLLFQEGGYFIHDASWRSNFGVGSNTVFGVPGGSFTGTHGCINVPFSAQAALYAWTPVGTPVMITP